jgi:uncharacterized spore protein YtfJ
MDTNEIITAARDAMTVRRVFGDPQVQDGVTVIPAALVIGGMGAGSGQRGGDAGEAGDSGDGGGFGVIALPRGAFTISAGRVRWHPTVSVNLLVVAPTAVAVTYLRARARSSSRPPPAGTP